MGVLDDIAAETSGKRTGGGVLDRIAAEVSGASYGKEETENMRREFVKKEGTLKTRVKEGTKELIPTRKQVADFARPALEGTGAALGGLGGAALGAGTGGVASPLLAVAGGATGYATGKYIADAIEGAPQSAPQTIKDLGTGSMYEMGGQGIAALGGKVLTSAAKAKDAVARNTPAVTHAGIKRKAGEIIAENSGKGAVYEKNAQETAKLKIPGYKPSIAESRNDPGLIKLQRSIERQPGTAGNIIMEQKAANQAAVKDYLANEFKGNESIDDVVNALNQKKAQIEATTAQAERGAESARGALRPADKQLIGRGITEELDMAVKPLKTAENEAWSKVPNYPIPTKNFDAAAERLQNIPLHKDAEQAVKDMISYAKRMDKTTEGLQEVERVIADEMYATSTKPNTKRVLGQLKAALADDFKAISEAADAGDIATHEGKVIFPAKLQAERETLTARIARDSAAAESAPDMPSVVKALKEAGDPPNQWMKQVNENQQQYQARLLGRYNTLIGDTPPSLSAEPPASVVDAQKRIGEIDNILANVEPAEDVAKAYREAKGVSKERFDRFGKGAIAEITQKGNQATGNRLPDSLIPAKIFTREGADDFLTAVGPENKAKAAAYADAYAAQDLLSKANPLSGEIPAKAVAAWIQKNITVLRKYGISDKYNTVAKAQAQAEVARYQQSEFSKSAASRLLNSDVDKAIGSAFSSNPSNTGAVVDELLKQIGKDKQGVKGLQSAFKDFLVGQMETTAKTISGDAIISPAATQKVLAKYAPAMRKLYANDPGKIAALQKVSKAVEIQSRSARSPIGGGSDTAELQTTSRSILGRMVDIVPGSGMVKGLARMGLGKLNGLTAQEVNKVIAKALYDPELAQTLITAKRMKPEVVEKRLNSHLITMGLAGITD